MPRVLLLCEYASLNGGELSLLAALDSEAASGFEFVAAALPDGPLADALRIRGIPIEPLQSAAATGGTTNRPSQAMRRERLATAIRRVDPDLLHANSLAMTRLSGPVADSLGVASIGHLRDIVRVSRRAMSDINRHSRILAVSRATRNFHLAAGLSPDKSYVLYNGVDLERFHPRPRTFSLHDELALPHSALLVGFVGQLGMRKGVDILLDAARKVVERFPLAHLVLIGTRHSTKQEAIHYERQLHTLATSPPLTGHVHFLGRRRDVPQLLPELTTLVHPARQEPLGRVLLEAAASALPVIATSAGGTSEIFPEPAMARLVPVVDAAALAQSLAEVLDDPPLRAALGHAARRRAEAAFDIRRAARELFDHYEAVVG